MNFVRPLSGGLLDSARVASSLGVELSVIMVVFRTGESLAESVRHVLDDRSTDEFIIIDNGSTPEEEAVLDAAATDGRVRLERGHGNVGFARGANMGAELAHGRVLVFLNPDAFLQPDCLSRLNASLDNVRSPRIVGARVLNVDGTEQRGARRGEVTPVTTLLSLTKLANRFRAFRGFEIHHQDDPEPEGVVPVPTISGACFAMTHEDFAAMGGFDVGYFLHVEDVDLCWRVRQSGGVVLFHPGASIIHLGSTSHTSPVKVEFWKGLGLARYFRKRADNPRRAAVAHILFPFILLVSLLRPLLRRNRSH
ncbi:MAG: glycosyltransferase family 2 protein [Caulobacteraceae bacterium]